MKILKLNEWPHRAPVGRWSAILLIAVGMQTLFAPPLQAATTKKVITDSGITAAVEGALKQEKGVSPNDVDVATSQGIVTLSGSVNDLLAKSRAVKIAESIRGVLGVIDLTTVTPVSRPDEAIRKDVLAALMQDPATESYQVAVSVQNAAATLTGSVHSYEEAQLATRVARGVTGLKEVHNNITINFLAKSTDAEIADDVKARLQWDLWIDGDQVNAAVKDGQVTLSGEVGSAISKSRAFDDAWVNGVTSVDNSNLKVDPAVPHEARQALEFAAKSDDAVKRAVLAALRLDPRVTAFSPDVNVEDGVVILGGTVGNLKAKNAAAQDARDIVSVWRVDNLLKVRQKEWPSDSEMQKQLKAALAWDPLLDSSTIDVAVIHRAAYLSGGIESSFQKAEAQDVASRIKGVVEVRNHLKVEPYFSTGFYDYDNEYGFEYGYGGPAYNEAPDFVTETFGPQPNPSDAQIKKNIEDGLFWSPFVHRDDITVTVDGGVATLTGTVGTWIGYKEADKDARQGGAVFVRNRLDVK